MRSASPPEPEPAAAQPKTKVRKKLDSTQQVNLRWGGRGPIANCRRHRMIQEGV